MATANGPDLTFATAKVESLMDDTCTITWDPEGVGDDVLDETSGVLHTPESDTTQMYDGKCNIKPWGTDQPRVQSTGGDEDRPKWYKLTIPVASLPYPEVGGVVVVTSSRRDQWLVGKPFIIKEVQGGSFAVNRKMLVELRL